VIVDESDKKGGVGNILPDFAFLILFSFFSYCLFSGSLNHMAE